MEALGTRSRWSGADGKAATHHLGVLTDAGSFDSYEGGRRRHHALVREVRPEISPRRTVDPSLGAPRVRTGERRDARTKPPVEFRRLSDSFDGVVAHGALALRPVLLER